MEYTKGEWKVRAKYDEQGWPTYRLKWMDNPNDKVEVEANAHLIAAAPALYEALEAVDDYLSAPYPENMKLKQIAADKLVTALALARRE